MAAVQEPQPGRERRSGVGARRERGCGGAGRSSHAAGPARAHGGLGGGRIPAPGGADRCRHGSEGGAAGSSLLSPPTGHTDPAASSANKQVHDCRSTTELLLLYTCGAVQGTVARAFRKLGMTGEGTWNAAGPGPLGGSRGWAMPGASHPHPDALDDLEDGCKRPRGERARRERRQRDQGPGGRAGTGTGSAGHGETIPGPIGAVPGTER